MHMQPIYRMNKFVKAGSMDVGADIFERGLWLPSDIKMTVGEQEQVIEIVKNCFK
ncbi:MAG: DegT/DnrJ/EryC1/StrS family aminotransferase [Lachnospiraceae bacterium]|nr:DegT/DnrJ/EryC1/StrS family aminotransferase [Lachnospiraceae bacterium]